MAGPSWRWDPSLYAGSAAYYSRGRIAYPPELVDRLTTELMLDGSGRLLDIGCGPGSLTLLLAGKFDSAVGIDADPDMIVEAGRLASHLRVVNVSWRHLRAEQLPADLGTFRMVTFAQSFHWMDRALVAQVVHGLLETDGSLVHVHATTHQGVDSDTVLPFPRPPRSAIAELITTYLGPARRAGQGTLPGGTSAGEAEIYLAAGFIAAGRIEVPGKVLTRTVDDIVAATFSLSYAAPHLFGDDATAFEAELRALLLDASSNGTFSEQMGEIAADVWRPSGPRVAGSG
jgi:SAM-dependent methyltransferase